MRWHHRFLPVALVASAALVVGAAALANAPYGRDITSVPVDPAPAPVVHPTPTPDPTTDVPTPAPEPSTPDEQPSSPDHEPTTPPSDATPPGDPTTPPADPAAPDGPSTDDPATIAAVQQRLTELGYYVAAIDGKPGPATVNAVMAFQKVTGLTVDGVPGPNTRAALEDPVAPVLVDGPPTRVDVDLDRQVLHLIVDGVRVRTVPVSSGSGETYTSTSGGTARALTPTGTFTVTREIHGVRHAPLGSLYNPKYFYNGFAIHGSPSVPAYPASHGCVRVPIADSEWLFGRIPVGTPVIVHGGQYTFAPEAGQTSEAGA